jgi:hydroxyacylglutathione hydrolase
MIFQQIRDDGLSQYAYLLGCENTGEALLIDPERDVDRYVRAAEGEELRITAVAETHIHADFLAGTRELADRTNADVYLSGVTDDDRPPYAWARHSDYETTFLTGGERFEIGDVELEVLHTPGHTDEHLSFRVTDCDADEPSDVLTGDFVLVGSLGRPDLAETSLGQEQAAEERAKQLYESVQAFTDWPSDQDLWSGHGAGSACGKDISSEPSSTVGDEQRNNPGVQKAEEGEDTFVDYILEGQSDPPGYFERMKELNRKGPPLMGDLPEPRRLEAEQMEYLAGKQSLAIVDTRPAEAFMQGHLPAAVLASRGERFAEIAGSYVTPNMPIYLIVEEDALEDTVRRLVRIGLDNVTGFATPDVLDRYGENHELLSTDEIDFDELEQARDEENTVVFDVRTEAEYEDEHVPGAVNVPHTQLLDHRSDIAMDQTLLVHCGGGTRASFAAALMERYGYNVRWTNDRFSNWAER